MRRYVGSPVADYRRSVYGKGIEMAGHGVVVVRDDILEKVEGDVEYLLGLRVVTHVWEGVLDAAVLFWAAQRSRNARARKLTTLSPLWGLI